MPASTPSPAEPGQAGPARPVISLLTDYGLDDGFVGALHGVILSAAPGTQVVDLTHGAPPHDIRAGSLALRRSVPYLAPGIVVAVVDPGVGTSRRAIAVRTRGRGDTGDNARGDNGAMFFVGPDNGLLVPAVEAAGGASVAVVLEDRGYWLKAPGPTFAGRDIFAPAAAQLALGREIAALGREIDPGSLVRLPAPVSRLHPDGSLEVEVTWVDRYGNVQLAAGPEAGELGWSPGGEGGSTTVAVIVGPQLGRRLPRGPWQARTVDAFAELGQGELGLLVDSYGQWALAMPRASAAQALGLREGDIVAIARSGDLPSNSPRAGGWFAELPELGGPIGRD